MKNRATLILAYRAEKGIFNALTHTLHRVFSPDTYACRLCYFTNSAFGMLRPFKNYLEKRPERIKFYHRREFRNAFPEIDAELPLVLLQEPDAEKPHILLDRAGIESCSNLAELIGKLEDASHPSTTNNQLS